MVFNSGAFTINELDLINIDKISASDEEAFSNLFRKYYPNLYHFAGRYVKDAYVAENIVQEVFVKLWTGRNELNISTNVKAYLYTAVKNHSLNHLKQDKRNVSLEDEYSLSGLIYFSPEDNMVKDEMHAAVHKAIDELPPQCRKIYVMKKYDDLSYDEISETLNISVNTVKTQMKRAVKALTQKLAYLKTIFLIIMLSRGL